MLAVGRPIGAFWQWVCMARRARITDGVVPMRWIVRVPVCIETGLLSRGNIGQARRYITGERAVVVNNATAWQREGLCMPSASFLRVATNYCHAPWYFAGRMRGMKYWRLIWLAGRRAATNHRQVGGYLSAAIWTPKSLSGPATDRCSATPATQPKRLSCPACLFCPVSRHACHLLPTTLKKPQLHTKPGKL